MDILIIDGTFSTECRALTDAGRRTLQMLDETVTEVRPGLAKLPNSLWYDPDDMGIIHDALGGTVEVLTYEVLGITLAS